MPLKDLSQRITDKRIELNLSQDDLAQKVGYTSRSSISKIEAGKVDLSMSKIKEFAKALNTTPADLMGWSEEEQEFRDTITKQLEDTLNKLNESDKKAVLNFADYLISKKNK